MDNHKNAVNKAPAMRDMITIITYIIICRYRSYDPEPSNH